MDKEAAWNAMQKIGELHAGFKPKLTGEVPQQDDVAGLRCHITALVIDNQEKDDKIAYLENVVNHLKRFRALESNVS